MRSLYIERKYKSVLLILETKSLWSVLTHMLSEITIKKYDLSFKDLIIKEIMQIFSLIDSHAVDLHSFLI